VRPRLTVNYGLRYDLDIPEPKHSNRFSAVDPTLPESGRWKHPRGLTYFGTEDRAERKDSVHRTLTRKHSGPRVAFMPTASQ